MSKKTNEKLNYYAMDEEEVIKIAKERLGIDDIEEWGYLKVIDMLEAADLDQILPADELFGANLEALQELINTYEFDTIEDTEKGMHAEKMKLWGVASAQLNALYDLVELIISK